MTERLLAAALGLARAVLVVAVVLLAAFGLLAWRDTHLPSRSPQPFNLVPAHEPRPPVTTVE